jgi:hypothetical protein
VKPTGVLNYRPLPRDRHGQQEGVQPGVVEAFADVPAGCQHEARLVAGEIGQTLKRCASGLLLNATVEHHQVRHIAVKLSGESVEVLTALGQDHWRTALAD